MPIVINLDVQLAKRKMKLTDLSNLVGISVQNLSVLKRGKARAIRFSTLEKLCEALECTPADLIEYRKSVHGNRDYGGAANGELTK